MLKPFKIASLFMAFCLIAPMGLAASSLHPDPDLLDVKGYSKEVIYNTGRQSLRQEWKPQETPYLSKWTLLKRNIWRNDWTGALNEFGAPSLSD